MWTVLSRVQDWKLHLVDVELPVVVALDAAGEHPHPIDLLLQVPDLLTLGRGGHEHIHQDAVGIMLVRHIRTGAVLVGGGDFEHNELLTLLKLSVNLRWASVPIKEKERASPKGGPNSQFSMS